MSPKRSRIFLPRNYSRPKHTFLTEFSILRRKVRTAKARISIPVAFPPAFVRDVICASQCSRCHLISSSRSHGALIPDKRLNKLCHRVGAWDYFLDPVDIAQGSFLSFQGSGPIHNVCDYLRSLPHRYIVATSKDPVFIYFHCDILSFFFECLYEKNSPQVVKFRQTGILTHTDKYTTNSKVFFFRSLHYKTNWLLSLPMYSKTIQNYNR